MCYHPGFHKFSQLRLYYQLHFTEQYKIGLLFFRRKHLILEKITNVNWIGWLMSSMKKTVYIKVKPFLADDFVTASDYVYKLQGDAGTMVAVGTSSVGTQTRSLTQASNITTYVLTQTSNITTDALTNVTVSTTQALPTVVETADIASNLSSLI